jgi:hypothetical protein
MNATRTNETLKISELISLAMLSSLSQDLHENVKNRYPMKKVEEGDPVRSAERVPYSSSHQLSTFASLPRQESTEVDASRKGEGFKVAAA